MDVISDSLAINVRDILLFPLGYESSCEHLNGYLIMSSYMYLSVCHIVIIIIVCDMAGGQIIKTAVSLLLTFHRIYYYYFFSSTNFVDVVVVEKLNPLKRGVKTAT